MSENRKVFFLKINRCEIGKRCVKVLEHIEVNEEILAEEIGIGRRAVSRYLVIGHGSNMLEMIRWIADNGDVSADWLLDLGGKAPEWLTEECDGD